MIILIDGIFSLVIFEFVNEKIIKVVYPYEYNEALLLLFTFKGAICLTTLFIIGLVYYRLYQYSYESLWSYLGFHKPNWKFLGLWILLLMALHSFAWAGNIHQSHIRLSENVVTYGIWVTLISTVIIAPVCEEIIFRGFLWRATLDAFQSERMALVVSSGLFALAHYQLDMSALVFYFISGWILLSARLTGGTLAFSIFLHFLHNFALTLETFVMMTQ